MMRVHPYAVVVSDIHMPGMDGPELVSTLKAIDPMAQVVMLSDDLLSQRVSECVKRGAVDFFAKEPGQIMPMVEAVSAALSRRARWASWTGTLSGWDCIDAPEILCER